LREARKSLNRKVNEMINIWAILVSTIIYFTLGALWYSPLLFGNIWVKALGVNMEDLEQKPIDFFGSAIAAFIATLFLALLLEVVGTYDVFISLLVALIVGVGFVLSSGAYNVLYEGKNYIAYLIDGGYHIIALLITGLILGLWQV
jgi:type III secretory pathway component EscU